MAKVKVKRVIKRTIIKKESNAPLRDCHGKHYCAITDKMTSARLQSDARDFLSKCWRKKTAHNFGVYSFLREKFFEVFKQYPSKDLLSAEIKTIVAYELTRRQYKVAGKSMSGWLKARCNVTKSLIDAPSMTLPPTVGCGTRFLIECEHQKQKEAQVATSKKKTVSKKKVVEKTVSKKTVSKKKVVKKAVSKKATTAAPKKKALGVGAYAQELIRAGKDNIEVLNDIIAKFPEAKTTAACISWYRNKLRKEGVVC